MTMTNLEKQRKRISRIEERIRDAKSLLEFVREQKDQTDKIQTLGERLKAEIKNNEIALLVAKSTP